MPTNEFPNRISKAKKESNRRLLMINQNNSSWTCLHNCAIKYIRINMLRIEFQNEISTFKRYPMGFCFIIYHIFHGLTCLHNGTIKFHD